MALVLVGAGFAVLVPPATFAQGAGLAAPGWLVLAYLLHTWAELALSPVGLSAMSSLAPARIGGLVMGVWFLAVANGNYVGGRLAGLYESMPLPTLFGAVGASAVACGIVMLLVAGRLTRLSEA